MVSTLHPDIPSHQLMPPAEGWSVSMTTAGSIPRNVAWTLAGNVVYSACQWALLVALARMGSPVQVGQLALGLAVTGPLFVATPFHLRGVQATDARGQFSFSDYLGLRWIGTILAAIITVGMALGCGRGMEIACVILLVGFSRVFDNLSDIYYGVLQQHERMARVGKSMMLKGVLALAGLSAAIWWTHKVVPAAAALSVVSALTFLLYDRRGVVRGPNGRDTVRVGALEWSPSRYWKLFCLALPLTIVMVLVSFNLNVPRYFIEKYRGEADLGIFAALSYLIVAGNTVINACGQATAPRLAKFYAHGPRRRFWWLLFQLLAIAAACGLAGLSLTLIAGKQILLILYGAAYAQRAPLLVTLMGAGMVLYASQFLGYGLTSARIFRSQVPLLALVTAVTAGACALLVPRLGLEGAAIGMGSGFGVQLVGSGAILFQRWLALRR